MTEHSQEVARAHARAEYLRENVKLNNLARKKAAFDRGVSEANGELFYTFDSDDEALPETLQLLNKRWHDIPETERHGFSGVTGLCVTANGDTIRARFPLDILDSDSQEIFHRYKKRGEKSGVHRTDVLRQLPFPMNVQGHVPEGIVWSAIATRFKTKFVNDPLRIVHFEPNSIMRSPFSAGLHAEGLSL